ncbi:MAG: MOSC domain-containing protein [Rhodobacteraceae bacterium]|nr:MOSC domain-containing protein [Paracoccaceae bacterium]
MGVLTNSGHQGRLAWIGNVTDRQESIMSKPAQNGKLDFGGLVGDSHYGETRPACVRVEELYPENTPIRNVRQISVVSREELDLIARDMVLDKVDPALVGANMVIEGIPDFTLLPPSSRLQFPSGATITIDMINLPCNYPAREIERIFPGKGKYFKEAACERRGVTAWVEREGDISIGDSVICFVPVQRPWLANQ